MPRSDGPAAAGSPFLKTPRPAFALPDQILTLRAAAEAFEQVDHLVRKLILVTRSAPKSAKVISRAASTSTDTEQNQVRQIDDDQ
jgi:hypothetical protein